MAIVTNNNFRVSNDTKNLNAQCKVVVYNWDIQVPNRSTTDFQLGSTSRLDISSQIMECEYNKAMGGPTGTFSITLTNSPNLKGSSGDWKDIIKKGTWLVIYMSQDGDLVMNPVVGEPLRTAQKFEEAKKIRCIGFIDRIVPNTMVDEKGAFDVTYTIEGRDFGVVYEDTEIWHNLFQFDRVQLDALANNELNIVGNTSLDRVLSIVHDLFFNPSRIPGAKINENRSLTSIALQWQLPRQLISDILGVALGPSSFWGDLTDSVTDFQPTAAGLAVEKPTDYLNGNAWEQLKKVSSPHFHELYTETDALGCPVLTFRPIPFALNKRRYRLVGKDVMFYKDLDFVSIPAINVINNNLAEDNHGRYNSFLATVSTDLYNTADNISVLQGSRFPEFQQASIKRYGFRPMHVTVDTIIKNAAKNGGKSDRRLLIEFNELLRDYWNNFIFTSSGTSEQIGNNEIKIGKAMVFEDDVPYEAKKRYYIEGYNDKFTVGEKGETEWNVSVSLTRGTEESDLQGETSLTERDTPFTQEGEYTTSGSGSNKG